MAKNEGKKFEDDFKKSVPEEWFYYRFKDSAGTWQSVKEESKTRFTARNICDCMIYNQKDLFLLELKSHKGKSLPLSCIRSNQLEGLLKAQSKGVKCYFIVNFRDLEETYIIDAASVDCFINSKTRKSIPVDYFRKSGDKIEQTKKRVRYTYNIKEIFTNEPI